MEVLTNIVRIAIVVIVQYQSVSLIMALRITAAVGN